MKSWSAKFDDSLMDIGHYFGAVQNIFRWLIIYFTSYFTTTCHCHRLGHGSIAVFQIGNQGWSSLPSEDSECCRLFPSFGFIITLRALFHPKLTPNFEMVADFVDEQYVGAILLLWHQTLSRIKFEQCHFWELAYRHIGLEHRTTFDPQMGRPTFQQTPIFRSDPADNGVLYLMLACYILVFHFVTENREFKNNLLVNISPYFSSKVTKNRSSRRF